MDVVAGLPQLQELIKRIITVAGGLVFFGMTVMLVVAWIRFLTSGGEPKLVQSAWQTFTWALLGILFLALGWLLLLLIQAFTGADVTHFKLEFPTP